MKRTLVFLLLTGATALSTVVISVQSSISQNIKQTGQIDFSLLVGEWGETGQCGQKRLIYMADGKYLQKINQGETWKTEYEGKYWRSADASNVIIIGDDSFPEGVLIEIERLTNSLYEGKMLVSELFEPKEYVNFVYQKCSTKNSPENSTESLF